MLTVHPVASDQYGNYLIQHILQTAAPHHREMVAVHIRKHMVSLRGSKFGSRVGMLCSNPNFGRNQLQSSPPNHRYNAQNSRNNWPYRSNNTPPASFWSDLFFQTRLSLNLEGVRVCAQFAHLSSCEQLFCKILNFMMLNGYEQPFQLRSLTR